MQKLFILAAGFRYGLRFDRLFPPRRAMHGSVLTPSVSAECHHAYSRSGLSGDAGKPVTSARQHHLRSGRYESRQHGGIDRAGESIAGEGAGRGGGKTNLYAPGRWAVILTATFDGKPVKGSVIVTASQKRAEAASPPPAASRRISITAMQWALRTPRRRRRRMRMGMDTSPVYADEGDEGSRRRPPHHREDSTRWRAHRRRHAHWKLATTVRATGTVAADENRQAVLTARFSGFVEKLLRLADGRCRRAGQPLMRVWIESPEVLVEGSRYIGSLASHAAEHAAMAANIAAPIRRAAVRTETPWPRSGRAHPLDHDRRAERRKRSWKSLLWKACILRPATTLFQDYRRVALWVLAEISERDLSAIRPGQTRR